MGLHFDRNPDHALNPTPAACYGCKLEGVEFHLPPHFRSQGTDRHPENNIELHSQLKQETAEILRNDKEGRFQKV